MAMPIVAAGASEAAAKPSVVGRDESLWADPIRQNNVLHTKAAKKNREDRFRCGCNGV